MSSYSSRSDSKASTCWMRSDHCWSHGPRQAERLVPGRQLYGPRPRVLGQRDRQHLQHDALHVVLGLRLGEAERVDLHAVAEPPLLVVLDAVALASELVPEPHERAHLAHLLDEPHAGVDEERHARRPPHRTVPAATWPESRTASSTAIAVRHRERELLHRRRAGLLQVIAADVDRVPPRDVRDGVGDQVGGQPHRCGRREHVGARARGTP